MNLPQSSYIGRHAELYDLFYADKPYAQEAYFVHECTLSFGSGKRNRVLELACGTGNHAFELEKLGYHVMAVDYSADMLLQARSKAQACNSSVDFRQQDMRVLDIPERPFDLVVCLFDSIGYVATNENLLKVLHGVRTHLHPTGLFIFEFWHAPAMIRHYEPVRVKRWQLNDREVLRVSSTELDIEKQLAKVSYDVYEMYTDGTYSAFSEIQTNRYFLLQEMAVLLSESGLQLLKAFSGFCTNRAITDETWHIVAIAQTAPETKGV